MVRPINAWRGIALTVLSITALYSPSLHEQKLAHVLGMLLALIFFFLMLGFCVNTLVQSAIFNQKPNLSMCLWSRV